jgi:hypothetical protein
VFEHFPQQPTAEQGRFAPQDAISPADIEDTIAATDLHSTSDALNLLSQGAQPDLHGAPCRRSYAAAGSVMSPVHSRHSVIHSAIDDSLDYPLVSQGLLVTAQVVQLVAR